jgi:transcriptional regulator
MEPIDRKICQLLAKGMTQREISDHLKLKAIEPNSVSIIEKRIKKLKKEFGAKTFFQLAVILTKRKYL